MQPSTASIGTTWAGVINPPRHNEVKTWTYEGEKCGQIIERSRNGFGSNLVRLLINLFQANEVRLADHLSVNEPVRMGEILAYKK